MTPPPGLNFANSSQPSVSIKKEIFVKVDEMPGDLCFLWSSIAVGHHNYFYDNNLVDAFVNLKFCSNSTVDWKIKIFIGCNMWLGNAFTAIVGG